LAQKLGAQALLTDQEFATGLLKQNVAAAEFEESSCPVVEPFKWGGDVNKLSSKGAAFDYILISDCINPVYGIVRLLPSAQSGLTSAPSSTIYHIGTDSWEKLALSIQALSSMDTVTFMSTQLRGGEAIAAFLKYSESFLQSDLVFETVSEYEDQGKLLVYRIRRLP
jgi:hypothetical protein